MTMYYCRNCEDFKDEKRCAHCDEMRNPMSVDVAYRVLLHENLARFDKWIEARRIIPECEVD